MKSLNHNYLWDEIVADYNAGMNTTSLQKKYGGHTRTILRYLKRHGHYVKHRSNPIKYCATEEYAEKLETQNATEEYAEKLETQNASLSEEVALLRKTLADLTNYVDENYLVERRDNILGNFILDKIDQETVQEALESVFHKKLFSFHKDLIIKDFKDVFIDSSKTQSVVIDEIALKYKLRTSHVKQVLVKAGLGGSRFEVFQEDILDDLNSGMTVEGLGVKYSFHPASLHRKFRKMGVKPHRKKCHFRHDHISQVPMREILEGLESREITFQQAVDRYGVSYNFLKKCLTQVGVDFKQYTGKVGVKYNNSKGV